MQILELLGSTASTAKVPQADLTSQKDAFAKHLNEVMSHRSEIRKDDARAHESRQDDRSDIRDERTDRPDREEHADEIDAKPKTEENMQEDVPADAKGDTKAGDTQAANTTAATANPNVPVDLISGTEDKSGLEAAFKTKGGEETVIGHAAADVLEEVVAEDPSGIVAALNSAHKANINAAFYANDKSRAPENASENAGPFNQIASVDPTVQGAEAFDPEKVTNEIAGLAQEVAVKTDMTDLSDDAQVTTQTVIQANAQQTKTPVTENADRKQTSEKEKIQPVVSETPLIKDAKIEVGPDPRLAEMQIAQALVEEAAADKIHAQFTVALPSGGGTSVASQMATAQSSGAMDTAMQNKPAVPVKGPNDGGLQLSGQMSERAEAAPKAPNQIAQPVPGQNALANMDPSGQSSMSERAAQTLAQMTAQSAQMQNSTKPSQAALPAAAAGAEAVSNAMNNTASQAPSAVVGEINAPNGTQMVNAAKPATPPPPQTPQPPQAQIAMHIAKGVQNGTDKISIRLNPSELGRVDIKLEVARDGSVTASVTVERPETLELLKGDARSLERALANAGLDPDSDKLSFNLRDPNNSNSSFAKNAEGDGKGSGRNEDGTGSGQNEEEVDVEAILAEARANAAHNRALDINV
jgi:hypothetical protein